MMGTNTGGWGELTGKQRLGVILVAMLQAMLVTLVNLDLARRPQDQLRFPKAAWRAATMIHPVGALAYLLAERVVPLPDRPAS